MKVICGVHALVHSSLVSCDSAFYSDPFWGWSDTSIYIVHQLGVHMHIIYVCIDSHADHAPQLRSFNYYVYIHVHVHNDGTCTYMCLLHHKCLKITDINILGGYLLK